MRNVWMMILITGMIAVWSTRASGNSFSQPEIDKLSIGDGINMVEGSRRQSCLRSIAADMETNQYQSVLFDLQRVNSVEEMQKLLRINASAKFGGGMWSAAANAQYMKSQSYSLRIVNFAVRVYVLNETSRIRKPVLDTGLPNDPVKFIKRCGDGYVSSVQTGGEFIAMLRYEASSEEEANRFATAISARSVNGPNVSVEVENALKQFKSNDKLTIKIVRKGPVGAMSGLSVEALIEYAKKFPALVSTASKNAYPISFGVTLYTVFGITPPSIDSVARDFIITRMGNYFDAVTQRIDRLQYLLSNSSEFSFVNKKSEIAGLRSYRQSLARYVDKLKADAKSCMDFAAPCSMSMLEEVPDAYLPKTLVDVGGCTQWSQDDATCLRCRYTAGQLGVSQIAERGQGLDALCRNMPPKMPVTLRVEGSVGCAFTNEFGNHCGDQNGAVDFGIILHLGWKLGAGGTQAGSSPFQRSNIRAAHCTIAMDGKATVPDDGLVHAFLGADHVQMWPNAHGPLSLDSGLALTIYADQAVRVTP